ncbi:MAG: alpha/beta fold hydrolase [Hyphomicrobiaceae bacterium]
MPFLEIGSDRVHYLDEGRENAPPVLMVHGSCGYAGQWRQLAEKLGAHYRVLRLDLPGMGDSDAMPIERQWTDEDDARAVSALLDLVGTPLHFVGHSAGCIFSWRALAARPHRIQSLTLFEPVFFGLIADDPAFSFPRETAAGYVRLADAGDIAGAMTFFVDRWAGKEGAWAALPEKVKSLMMKGAGRLRHEWFNSGRDGFYPFDRAAWLQELSDTPTLLVQGTATVPAAARVCDRFAELRPDTSRLHVPGAGHMVPFTHAPEVIAAVEAHLAGANG